jgi:hypothetical protein
LVACDIVEHPVNGIHDSIYKRKCIKTQAVKDSLIWQHDNNRVYTTSSLYNIINFRGVTPVWKLQIPPKVQIFLWLMSRNKLVTRDNLKKIDNPDDLVFYIDDETELHIFHDCIVARKFSETVSQFFSTPLGHNLESVSRFWLSE